MSPEFGIAGKVTMRKIAVLLIGITLSVLPGCGGSPRGTTPPIPGIAGSWELIAVSSQHPGSQTGIEVNLQQGKALVNELFQPTAQLSAVGTQQMLIVGTTLDSAGNISSVNFGGFCPGAGVNTLNGTVDVNYNVNLTYSQAGNQFNATALLSSDFKSMTGTYSSQSGSGCTDSGLFTGLFVPKLSGTYTGQLVLPDGTTDAVSATLSESSATKLSANLIITGTDNTSLSLAGVVNGNAFNAQGTFQSQSVTYYGYAYTTTIESGINQGLTQNSIYLVNATDTNNLIPAGTLSVPIPPP